MNDLHRLQNQPAQRNHCGNRNFTGVFNFNIVFQRADIKVYAVFTVGRHIRQNAIAGTAYFTVTKADTGTFRATRFDQRQRIVVTNTPGANAMPPECNTMPPL